eukprot:CAMPEP_0113543332 /NCGR_PEP_ID=MMETSP0015_2-20120614/10100_1 /TAXON_ID=2838 /ORGANISM="Odontella" /LENGTH=36 /DNA_ID=CAMNT_0000443481 /DNA_START=126 /DNA_END=232 /DNA_ORIENTATION=+ /assembly_acc=CAM_ASM_000160
MAVSRRRGDSTMMGRSAVGGLMISAAALVALTNGAS